MRSWSDKKREEMTERDWRIFREDFSISYKGNTGGTLPLRNWEEAGLPDTLMKVSTRGCISCHTSPGLSTHVLHCPAKYVIAQPEK